MWENENHFQVVKNVSFSIRSGEILAIAGVSGNGQVEIADAIVGLLPGVKRSDFIKWKRDYQ